MLIQRGKRRAKCIESTAVIRFIIVLDPSYIAIRNAGYNKKSKSISMYIYTYIARTLADKLHQSNSSAIEGNNKACYNKSISR